MAFWKIFQVVLQMAPMIIQLVRQVETAMPGRGLGVKKLELVQNIVQIAANAEPEVSAALSIEDLAAVTTSVVNAGVAVFNAAGVFVKSGDKPE